jgi:hypothetical protein
LIGQEKVSGRILIGHSKSTRKNSDWSPKSTRKCSDWRRMIQDSVQSVIEASKDPSYLVSNSARKDYERLRNGAKKDSHWSLC